jgi:hypothetical protein
VDETSGSDEDQGADDGGGGGDGDGGGDEPNETELDELGQRISSARAQAEENLEDFETDDDSDEDSGEDGDGDSDEGDGGDSEEKFVESGSEQGEAEDDQSAAPG